MKFLKPLVKLAQVAGSIFVKNPQRKQALEQINKDIVDPLIDSSAARIDVITIVQALYDAKLTPEQIKIVLSIIQGLQK